MFKKKEKQRTLPVGGLQRAVTVGSSRGVVASPTDTHIEREQAAPATTLSLQPPSVITSSAEVAPSQFSAIPPAYISRRLLRRLIFC